jgi:aryl-alcohol dehydrogenase-like predicted oxidoreductase
MNYEGKYVNLGNSGLKVSRLALGLGFRGTSDPKEAGHTVSAAIDSGINFFDCSNIYGLRGDPKQGRSEEILGRAIKGRREDLVITSKVASPIGEGPNDRGASRYHIMREVERSLKYIGTDHLDIYLLHEFDPSTPLEVQLRTMETLVQQGKIRYTGVCNFKAWQVVRALSVQEHINAQALITVQNGYSLINRSLEQEMFPMIRATGLGVMAFSALGLGLLSGVYSPDTMPSETDFWGYDPKFRSSLGALLRGQVADVLEAVRKIAQQRGNSVPQIATAWVLAHEEVSTVVLGVSKVKHLEDSLGAMAVELNDEEMDELNKVSEGLGISILTPDDLRNYSS